MSMNEQEIEAFLSRLSEEPRAQVKKVRFPDLSEPTVSSMKIGLRYLEDVRVTLRAELGEQSMQVREFLALNKGSILQLDKVAGDTVVLQVNGLSFARGEVIVIDDSFAIRLHVIEQPRVFEVDEVL